MANKNKKNRAANDQKAKSLNEDRKENLKITDSDSKKDSTNLSKSGKGSTDETKNNDRSIHYSDNETFQVTNEKKDSVEPVEGPLNEEETPKELKTKESDEQEDEISSLNSSYATAFDEWECSSQTSQINEMSNEIEEKMNCKCNVEIENLRKDLEKRNKDLKMYKSKIMEKYEQNEKLCIQITNLNAMNEMILSSSEKTISCLKNLKDKYKELEEEGHEKQQKIKELEENENRFQQKIQKLQNERTEKQNVFDRKLAEKGKENKKLQEENSRLSVEVKEKEATIKSLRSKTEGISRPELEKEAEKSDEYRRRHEELQKMRDNLKNGYYLEEEKKKTERLLSAKDNSKNKKMVDSELKRLKREFEKYLQDVEKNIEQMEKTGNIDNIPSLSKMPELSKRFMEEYNALNIQDEPSTSSDSQEKSLNDKCIICHQEMTSDSEILKCEVCTTRYHLNCLLVQNENGMPCVQSNSTGSK